LDTFILFVDVNQVRVVITTEKSKKKNVPNRVVKTIQNENILYGLKEALNYSIENNVKNIFIVAEYDFKLLNNNISKE